MKAKAKTFYEAAKLGFPDASDLVKSMCTYTGYMVLPYTVHRNEDGENEVPLDQYLAYCETKNVKPDVNLEGIDPSEFSDYITIVPSEEIHNAMKMHVLAGGHDDRKDMRKFLQEEHKIPKRQAALWANQAMALSRHI